MRIITSRCAPCCPKCPTVAVAHDQHIIVTGRRVIPGTAGIVITGAAYRLPDGSAVEHQGEHEETIAVGCDAYEALRQALACPPAHLAVQGVWPGLVCILLDPSLHADLVDTIRQQHPDCIAQQPLAA